MFLPRTIFAAILAAFVVLAQPSPPAQGFQLGYGYADVRFPLTVNQCEPVFIYYHTDYSVNVTLSLISTYDQLLVLGPVLGIGYLEWICNLPAGYGFRVFIAAPGYPFVVQPGSTSSCLGNITATYQYASYNTTVWTSYTAISPATAIPTSSFSVRSTVPFPTGSFSTITVTPQLIATPTSSYSPSPTRSASSRKSRAPAIAGGVIGGLVVVAVAFSVIFIRLRKRRTLTRHLEMTDEPIATSPSQVQPGWVSNTSGPPLTEQYTSVPTSSSAIASTLDWDPSMLPVEVASASNARQGEVSLHSAGSVPASSTQPGVEPDSSVADTVTAFNAFSRLPPERMRALLPVFNDMVASRQPSEG